MQKQNIAKMQKQNIVMNRKKAEGEGSFRFPQASASGGASHTVYFQVYFSAVCTQL